MNCKATSTWSVCGRARETAFTHRYLSPDRKEETSQLDNIIGPMRRNDEIYIRNDVRTWASWDHYTMKTRIQNEAQSKSFSNGNRKKKWTGWKPRTDEQTVEFRKMVMEKNEIILKMTLLQYRRPLRLPPVRWRITRKQKEKTF